MLNLFIVSHISFHYFTVGVAFVYRLSFSLTLALSVPLEALSDLGAFRYPFQRCARTERRISK